MAGTNRDRNSRNSAMPRARKEDNNPMPRPSSAAGSKNVNQRSSTPMSEMEGPNTKSRFAGLNYGDAPVGTCNSGTIDSGDGFGTSRRATGR